jgi:hypothetical protein
MPKSSFDLCDEEGLEFEQEPAGFVLLDRSPIVWTVRGIRYFQPRFALVGVQLSSIHSRTAFEEALERWLQREWELLTHKIARRALDPNAPVHRFLLAIAEGDTALAQELADRLTGTAQTGD